MQRLVGGTEIDIEKQKKAKELSRLQVVDDGKKEQQMKKLELELEEEQKLITFDNESSKAEDIVKAMTTAFDHNNRLKSLTEDKVANPEVVCCGSKVYLANMFPLNQSDDYQTLITQQREGLISMDNLTSNSSYKEFLAKVLIHCGIIGIERFRGLLQVYVNKNKDKLELKTPEKITNQDVARDISQICFIFRNGF